MLAHCAMDLSYSGITCLDIAGNISLKDGRGWTAGLERGRHRDSSTVTVSGGTLDAPNDCKWHAVLCRPRRRSRYSAADEALDLEQYSDAEYDDDLGSGSLGRDESGRKKVGRPIAYKGDPNSPHLTEDERRRIKRWVPRAICAHSSRHLMP